MRSKRTDAKHLGIHKTLFPFHACLGPTRRGPEACRIRWRRLRRDRPRRVYWCVVPNKMRERKNRNGLRETLCESNKEGSRLNPQWTSTSYWSCQKPPLAAPRSPCPAIRESVEKRAAVWRRSGQQGLGLRRYPVKIREIRIKNHARDLVSHVFY